MMDDAMTCPRRMSEMGPWKYQEGLDRWVKRGPDRVCSFCGSMHPDDFEAHLDRVLADERASIEQSDKGYKVYVTRPEVQNATQGAVKFYKQHMPRKPDGTPDPDHVARVSPKFDAAICASRERFARRMAHRRWMREPMEV